MADLYSTTKVLVLFKTENGDSNTISWSDAINYDSLDPFVVDFNGDGDLDIGIDLMPFSNDAVYTGYYITYAGGTFAVYSSGDSSPTFHVPHNGELDDYPRGSNSSSDFSDNLVDSVICFTAGSLILTADQGAVPVESLNIGQHLFTSSGSQQIKFIFKQRVQNTALYFDKSSIMPVRILQGALGADMPNVDLLISPSHALLIEGNLVEAHALVNGTSIYQEEHWGGILEYYHIELEDHAIIYANNVQSETFIDNVSRATFDNHDEYLALYGEADDMQELEYPRAKSSRQLPRALKQRLAGRAAILYPELVVKKVA